jgi:protein-tyrosine phosphatase
VRAEDFHEFDLLLAMDAANVRDLAGLAPNDAGSAKLVLLRDFDPLSDGDADVPDPYYGGVDGFEHVFQMVHRSCVSLLDALEKERAG